MDFDRFPGGALVQQGPEDLGAGKETEAALLVAVGAPRLRQLGIMVPAFPPSAAAVEHRLYRRLALVDPDAAHSRYNALIRCLVSFERAADCALAEADRIRRFMRGLGTRAAEACHVYFTG